MSKPILIMVALSCVLPAAALAQEVITAEGPAPSAAPGWDLAAEGQLALSLQRLGMLADLKLRAKKGLYASDSEFLKDNFVNVALTTQVSPVFAHAGAQVELQPAAFVKLSGGYHFVGYFGSMGSLRSPTDCGAVNTAGDARCDFHPIGFEDNPAGVSASGHRFWLEAQLMGRVGPVIAVAGARAERWLMSSPGAFWVNELYGVPQAQQDSVITGGGALLYAVLDAEGSRPELLLGAADDLGLSVGTGGFYNRVGPVASLRAPKWGAFREVTAQVAVLFYTHERYLTGWPYVALALSAATPNFLK